MNKILSRIGLLLTTLGLSHFVFTPMLKKIRAPENIHIRFYENNKNQDFLALPANSKLQITYLPYVVQKSQIEGEKELIKLASTFPTEGSWLFTPEDQNWYHNSSDHEEVIEDDRVRFSTNLLSGVFHGQGRSLIHYHTHPIEVANHTIDDFQKRIFGKVNDDVNEKTVGSIVAAIYLCFPSRSDLEFAVGLETKLTDPFSFEGRIASPMGITKIEVYDLSTQTIEDYSELNYNLAKIIVKYGLEATMNDGKPVLEVNPPKVFDYINEQMTGRLKLTIYSPD